MLPLRALVAQASPRESMRQQQTPTYRAPRSKTGPPPADPTGLPRSKSLGAWIVPTLWTRVREYHADAREQHGKRSMGDTLSELLRAGLTAMGWHNDLEDDSVERWVEAEEKRRAAEAEAEEG